MNNIFENAYFGKAYKTRDGKKAIFLQAINCATLAIQIEGRCITIDCTLNGEYLFKNPLMDIVSEWQEPIDEKKLDEISSLYVDESSMTGFYFNGYDTYDAWSDDDITNAYKAGYRKALEQL